MSALAWTPFAFVMFMVTLPLWKKLWALSENLPDLPGRLGESNLPEILGKSALPTIAAIGAVAYLGYASGGGGVLAPGFPTLPDEAAGAPNAPNIQSITAAGDSVTFRVSMNDFAGSQADTHDSTRILVDSAGKDFTAPLVDSVTGPQTTDTISHGFAHSGVYDFRALYKGASGGWSDTSAVFQKTVSFDPDRITTLSVTSATDSSLTLQWVTVHNGQGEKANHSIRRKNVTGDTASFSWGGSQEFDSEVFDSAGTNIGDTVTYTVQSLSASNTYEFGIKAYSGTPNVDATYGETSNIASGATTSGSGGDPVAPSTPTITLSATSDTNSVQMTGSGFDGENQTHDSTEWRLDNAAGMGSPFYTLTTAADLTSHEATDNANLDADATVYGDVRYFASSTGWTSRSAVDSVVNAAPGDNPNEPAGLVTVADRGFDALDEGWTFDFCTFNCGRVDIVSSGYSGSAPISPDNVVRFEYQEGLDDGSGNNHRAVINFSQSDTVYVREQIQLGSNFYGHPAQVKQWYLKTHNPSFASGWRTFMGVVGSGNSKTGNLTIQIRAQEHSKADGTCCAYINYSSNVSSASVSRGQWFDLEYLFVANTPGVLDGVFKVWVDGELTHHYTDVGYSDTDSGKGFNAWEFDAIWGGNQGATVPETFYVYHDHLYLSIGGVH